MGIVRESKIDQLRNKNESEIPTGSNFHFIQDTCKMESNKDFTFSIDYWDSGNGNER